METIQPFIDLGWNTVPLRGQLKRLEDGSKSIPYFEENWRAKYQLERNTIATPLGGVITGEVSGIIAVDCDNTATWQLFRALDPDYTFVFRSLGKLGKDGEEKDCGTFIYSYDDSVPDNFSINDGSMALDLYSNRGFVYLPTAANQTKVQWGDEVPAIKPIPAHVMVIIQQLIKAAAKTSDNTTVAMQSNVMTANCLAPLIRQYNANDGKMMPGLFRIITPKDFRDTPEYVKSGCMHPNDVPEGRGSEYLMKVSAILGADLSVDEDLYSVTMHNINNMFDNPMQKQRLDATIIDPMMRGNSKIDGKPIWKYDKDWEQFRLVLGTKRQSALEVCFDDHRNMYYAVDVANEQLKSFNRDGDLFAFINAACVSAPKKQDALRSMPIVNVTAEPNKPFGFNQGSDPTARSLNPFKQTPELAILSNPESYRELYKHPTTTLKFLETLVPEVEMREFLLGFTKRKLTTFGYSPVILYFLGVHGSGKDTYVQILEQILGHVSRPTVKEFLEMFNGWMMDSYIVQLDEYGNQLTRVSEREEALGKLKAYTGKQNVQIRAMRSDGFMYKHNATFIMTANKNPLMMEDGDRRVALLSTPNVLAEMDWVNEIGGPPAMHAKIMAETKDFAYYLATEVTMLTDMQYMKPPESESKRTLVADSMYAAQRIAYALKHGMRDYLVELANDHGCAELVSAIEYGRIYTDDMEPLYGELTEHNGDMRSLNKICKASGIDLIPTTHRNEKRYYYRVAWLTGDDAVVRDRQPAVKEEIDLG